MRLDADVGLAEGSDLILMNAKWAVGLKGAAGGVIRKEEGEGVSIEAGHLGMR